MKLNISSVLYDLAGFPVKAKIDLVSPSSLGARSIFVYEVTSDGIYSEHIILPEHVEPLMDRFKRLKNIND